MNQPETDVGIAEERDAALETMIAEESQPETEPGSATLLYQGQASIRIVTDEEAGHLY